MNERETCVICHKQTNTLKTTHIDKREYYVEGCGEICPECWQRIYGG